MQVATFDPRKGLRNKKPRASVSWRRGEVSCDQGETSSPGARSIPRGRPPLKPLYWPFGPAVPLPLLCFCRDRNVGYSALQDARPLGCDGSCLLVAADDRSMQGLTRSPALTLQSGFTL